MIQQLIHNTTGNLTMSLASGTMIIPPYILLHITPGPHSFTVSLFMLLYTSGIIIGAGDITVNETKVSLYFLICRMNDWPLSTPMFIDSIKLYHIYKM